ncbi:MDR family MFS transporter [Pseudactinotalea sp.]|uniref:MDR family MFS transporter n=1 Tax=Pseudactinotalea sp. TaxID=1926260 RepID=UPI003B3B04A4
MATTTSTGVGFRSERGPILASTMLATSLVAIDATILATAIPAIVTELGGLTQAPWLFSVYLLAQAATVPVYGKLADVVGRKPIMVAGVLLFLLGSVLCAVAPSMVVLILARGVQGLGAGAVQPMAQTIVADVYSIAERAKVQGYMASVWAISSVVGPTLGGVFTTYLDWRWIFWVNLPLGAIALLLMRRFRENHERTSRRIDILGSALLTAGSAAAILFLLEGGVSWEWLSTPSVALIGGGLLLLAVFAIAQRFVADTVLPGWLFASRLLNTTNAISLLVGALLIGLTAYVPIFAQTVLGQDPLIAGFALAALTLGWPIAASQAGNVYLRIGFKATGLIGASIAVVGTLLLNLAGHGTSVLAIAGACFAIGLGMGLVATPTLIAAQASAETGTRGVVTGANMFARSLGSAFGVAIYGAVVNTAIAGAGELEDLPASVLAPPLQQVFIGVAIAAVLLLAFVLLMPRGSRQPHLATTQPPAEQA